MNRSIRFGFAMAAMLFAASASAQTNTWLAPAGNWSNGSNWSNGVPPTDGSAALTFGSSASWSSNVDLQGPAAGLCPINSLTLTNSGNGIFAGSSNTINFVNNPTSGASPSILMNSTGNVQIACPIYATGNLNITVAPGAGVLQIGQNGTAYWITGGGGNITITNSSSNTVLCGDLGHQNLGPATNYFTVAAGAVKCSDGPLGGGDVFGAFTVLNVLAGGSYDFNTNAESMGAIQGAGNIMGNNGISTQIPGNFVFSGNLSGPGALTQAVVGTLTLGGSNNDTGAISASVVGGQIQLANANAALNSTVSVSVANGLTFNTNGGTIAVFNLGGLSGSNNASLTDANGFPVNVSIGGNNASTSFTGLLSGLGGLTKVGTGTLTMLLPSTYAGTTTVAGGYLKINAATVTGGNGVNLSGGTLEMDGNAPNFAPATFSAGANTTLIRNGGGGVISLSGSNKFGGSSLQLYSGGLAINDTANNALKLSASPAFTLGSGIMSLTGNAGSASAETVSSTNLLGAAEIAVNAGANQNASLNLRAISFAGGSALNVALNNSGSGLASVVTTNSNAITGLSGGNAILGGNAVVNGSDWATTGSGSGPFNITPVPASAYTPDGAWSATTLNSVSTSGTLAAGSTTAALRFNNSGAPITLTLSGTNSITSGGLLVTPNLGNNAVTLSGGSIVQASGTPLYLDQYNPANALTIATTLINSPVTLTASSAFSKGVTQLTIPTAGLYAGMVVSSTNSGIPANDVILSINGSNSLTLTLATANSSAASFLTFNGGSPIVKSGPGSVVLTSAANTLNGGILLNEGSLNFTTPAALGLSTNPICFNGGTLYPVGISVAAGVNPWLLGPSGGTVNIDPGQIVSRSGADIIGAGSLIQTGSGTLTIGSAASAFAGQIYVNQGTLSLTLNTALGSAQGATVAPGAAFAISANNTATYAMASGAVLTLNGSGAGNAGAFQVGLQNPAGAAPVSTFSNPIYLAGNSLITQVTGGSAASGTATLKLSGAISGPGSLIKGGDGILQITSAYNTYGGAAGSTSVLNGTLRLSAVPNGLPATTNVVLGDPSANTSATLDLEGGTQTVASLQVAGNGGNNAVINSPSTNGALIVNYEGSTPMVYTGALGGTATPPVTNFTLAVTGTGSVVLDGFNNYRLGTTVNPGAILQLGNGDNQGSITGNVTDNGSLIFAGGVVTGGGVISGSGSITVAQVSPMSSVTITGTNTYSGATYIQNGILVASVNPLPATTNVVLGSANTSNAGVLQLGDDSAPVNQTVTGLSTQGMGTGNGIWGGNGSNSTLTVNLTANSTYSGSLGSSLNFNANNLSLVLGGTSRLTLTGTSSYVGPTTVNGGILEAGSAWAFSPSSAYSVNLPAALRLSGNSVSVGSITGAGTIENANAVPGLITTGYDNTNTTFSGLIRNGSGGGALGLTKAGAGVLTLPGSNTYTGLTTISGGAIQLFGQTSQASPYKITNGGALDVSIAANTAAIGSGLTLGSAPGDAMSLDFNVQSAWSQTVPMLSVSGPITTSGTTAIYLTSTSLPAPGNYPLINYSGSILGSGSAGFAIGGLPNSRMTAILKNDPVHDELFLDVTYSDYPKWTGAVNGNWDTTTANWAFVYSHSATTYIQSDNVLFDDTAGAENTSVTLTSAMTPNNVTFANNTLPYNLSGAAITGPGSLLVSGSGLVVLANDNTYTGGTTISAGTLQLGNGGTTGSVTGNVTDNGKLAFNHSDNPTYAGTISGSGGLAHIGSGVTTLTGNSTYTGLTSISNGTLQVGAGGNTGMIAGNVLNNGALVFSRSDTAIYNGSISGYGGVTQAGPGTLVFNGNHTYSGLTTISAGTLQIGSGGGTGSLAGDVAFPSQVYNYTALVFARSDTTTYGGAVSGLGQLIQQGPGNLVLTGTGSTYSEGTVFSGGTITIASDANLGLGQINGVPSGDLIFNNGTLAFSSSASISSSRNLYPNGAAANINLNGNNVIMGAQIQPGAGTGSIVVNGPGTMTLTNNNNTNTGNPPHAGSTLTVNHGVLSVDNFLEVPTLQVVLNGSTLQLTNQMGPAFNAYTGTLTGPVGLGVPTSASQFNNPFTTNIQVGVSGGTIDTGGNSITTVGQITGAAGTTLTKIGSGTWCPSFGLGGSGFAGNVHIVSGAILDPDSSFQSANTDAFSNSTVVTIDAGAAWDDSWGNGEDMGGIAGAGDIYERIPDGITLEANVSTVFSGRILAASTTPTSSTPTTWAPAPGGIVNITQAGGGSITLSNTASNYGGATTIDSGAIIVSANVLPNQTGPLGQANSAILVGNTSGTSNATLLIDTAGVQIGRAVQLQSGNTGVATVGGINTSGTVSYTNNIVLGTASSAAMPLTVTAAPGGTVVFSGPLLRPTGATGSADTITMVGGGTVVFAAPSNNYLGATLVQNGTLVAAGGNNTLPTTTTVTLGDTQNDSGVLQLGSAGGPVSQTVAGLAVAGNGSGNAVVGGYSALPSTLTVNTNSIGIFGGTLGGSAANQNNLSFALSGSGQFTLTGSNSYVGTTTVSGGTLSAGSTSAFGVNSAVTVAAGGTALLRGNNLTIGSLAGSGTVANSSTTAAQLTVGADNTNTQFTGLLQNGTSAALSLNKTGSGTLTIGGLHTYTGATTVGTGMLQLLGGASLASSVTVNPGAALGILDTSAPATVALNSGITFGTGATSLNFNLQGGWSTTTPLLASTGAITPNGTTTINLASILPPAIGLYPLLNYGSLGGGGSADFTLGTLPSTQISAQLMTVNNSLVLDVTAINSSTWTGAASNVWDQVTTNWAIAGSGSATTYSQGNNVQFSDSGANTAISLPGTVTPGSVQFSNSAVAYSISGPGKISGNTALVMTGSGLVTLNTNNDYTGGTFVNGGTLQLGSGGATGGIVGNVANNALVVFNRSDAPTFAGVISGTGAVAQNGSGLLTLLANNTYSGLTTVSAGSLQLGNGGTTGGVAANIANNGTVIFNRADSPLYAGSISGNGSLVQQGPGTTILTGSNTYTGGTSINNGGLQIGNGGTSGSIAGNVVDNGTMIVNRSNGVTYAGVISGTGSLVQQGAGTLVLTANSIYTGGTNINSGAIQLGNGGNSGSIVGNVAIGGTLIINQSGSITLGGLLSGNGNVSQIGKGYTTITGTNTYAGGTTISAGTVSIGNYQNLGTGLLTLNGGALQITGDMGQVTNGVGDPLTFAGTEFAAPINLGASGGTLDTGSHWFVTTGQMKGAGNLTKIGTGTWYCAYGLGGSGYTGNINILQGALVDDANNFPGGNTDAISDTTVVIVGSGATWDDSWGNGEAMGGIAGAGTVLEAFNESMSYYTTTAQTFSGAIHAALNGSLALYSSGANTVGITELGGGTLTLTGTASDYGGSTTVAAGTIVVGANVLPNQSGPLGWASSPVIVGSSSGVGAASLLVSTSGVTFGRNIQLQSGNTGVMTIGGLNTKGTVYYTGQIVLGSNGAAPLPLNVTAATGGTVEIDGQITDDGTTTIGDSLTKVGGGTLLLTNPNSDYQGPTTITNGAVVVSANVLPYTPGPLGAANSQVLLGNTSGSSSASLLLSTSGVQFGRNILVQSGNTGTMTIGGLNTGGLVDFMGNITLGGNGLTVTSGSGGGVEIDGQIAHGGVTSGAADTLNASGAGTLILTNSTNSFGELNVASGTVVVAAQGVLPQGSELVVGTGAANLFGIAAPSTAGISAPAASAEVAAVPEPGSLILLAVAGLLITFRLSRRRKN
jgi:fibronectin-binding autotransporter adhesin